MKILFLVVLVLFAVPSAYAHTTITVEPYQIQVGWGTEPSVVGFKNSIVLEVTKNPSGSVFEGVTNAFTDLDATVKFGALTKSLDVDTDSSPGHYYSKIIPTKIGSYSVKIMGTIDGTLIDIEIPVEDVEVTDILDFPPRTSSDAELDSIEQLVRLLDSDIKNIRSDLTYNDNSFDLAVLGVSMGAVGMIMGIIAIIKKR